MAEIAAFKGVRYDKAVVGELDKVVSPPYDIISPEDRVYYHELHPANFVRLVLGEERESDSDADNRFTRARGHLDDWLASGVMKQDPQPAIYVYRQLYCRDGRELSIRGLTCAVKLHDYADGVILPHENTLAKPKSQLIQLMRQVQANLDSVYGLYADPDGVIDALMDRAMAAEPVSDAHDKDGVRHQLWAVTDPVEIAAAVDFMRDKPIAIADGHHRYETALAYKAEANAAGRPSTGSGCGPCGADWLMMTIANVHQKDMTIFPTHRVVAGLDDPTLAQLEGALADMFEVAPSTPESLLDDMARLGAIGLYHAGRALTLKPRPAAYAALPGSEASRKLELNVLHKAILEPILGIDDEKLRNQTHIIYTRDAAEATRLVDSGERQLAFLINPIEVKAVLDIAQAGERMPQKATYFYPKLLSGLVLRRIGVGS